MDTKTLSEITKQDFKDYYKAGNLGLVASLFKHTKEQASDKLNGIMQSNCYSGDIPCSDTTSVDVANQGEYMQTKVYIETVTPSHKRYSPVDFIYVESIIDNSKCNTCSWDTIETNTLVYRWKK